MGHWKCGVLLILVGYVYCCSGLFNSDKLLNYLLKLVTKIIFKFHNYKFDLKDNFVNNKKTRMLADF